MTIGFGPGRHRSAVEQRCEFRAQVGEFVAAEDVFEHIEPISAIGGQRVRVGLAVGAQTQRAAVAERRRSFRADAEVVVHGR